MIGQLASPRVGAYFSCVAAHHCLRKTCFHTSDTVPQEDAKCTDGACCLTRIQELPNNAVNATDDNRTKCCAAN